LKTPGFVNPNRNSILRQEYSVGGIYESVSIFVKTGTSSLLQLMPRPFGIGIKLNRPFDRGGDPLAVKKAKTRAQYLFGGGLIFFIVGIVTAHPAIIGFGVLMLVGALIYRTRPPKSSDKT
jgi:hypothetical protein